MSASPLRCAARLLTAALVGAGVLVPGAGAAADEAPGPGTVVGELVQAYPEDTGPRAGGGPTDAPLSWVRTAAGQSVRVPTDDVADLPAGSTVSVDVGGKVRDAASGAGYGPATAVQSAAVLDRPSSSPAAAPVDAADVTNQVTVALVAPGGTAPDDVEVGRLAAAVDGPVRSFWAEETGGAIELGVTAEHGWVRTPVDCRDPNRLWADVARRVGFVPAPRRHLVLYLSSAAASLPGCSYALAQVGSGPASGGSLYVRDLLPSVIAHELGHNFGLGHSSSRQCDGAVETGRCRTEGYRDYYDVMGASWTHVGALTAAQADRLGVLPAAARADVAPGSPAGTYRLAPLAGTTGTRALRLTAADGAVYWLEYRAPTGRDAWLGTADNRFDLQSGVLVHRAGELPDTALLLDGTPATAARWDDDLQAALPVGVAVPLDGGAFTVTVERVGAAAAVAVAAGPDGSSTGPSGRTPPAPSGDVLPERRHPAADPVGPVPAPTATRTTATPAPADAPVAGPDASAAPSDGAALDEAAAVTATPGRPVGAALCALAGCAGLVGGAAALRRRRGRARPMG